MKENDLLEFSKILSGIFSNKEQALDNPKNFAHIQIHFRPLFFKTFKCYAFYSEQRYQHDIWNPYKQSINKLTQEDEVYVLSTHKITSQERFTGGAFDISILDKINKYNLSKRYGCSMHFKKIKSGIYSGSIEPGGKCYIQNGSKMTYLKSEVILNKKSLISEDSGYELQTDKKIWGSNSGPLKFKKIENFDHFIQQNWK
tara:strand:- start:50 stop:649 length:600 start_codon:yes stop_codon:yes gene_type:complete